LKWIKNDPDFSSIPVVVLSSSAAERDVTASYAGHANGYVTKPLGVDGYNSLVNGLGNYWFWHVHTPIARSGQNQRHNAH
jgi:two-component system, chemotaxis family, response regulator Rcp1